LARIIAWSPAPAEINLGSKYQSEWLLLGLGWSCAVNTISTYNINYINSVTIGIKQSGFWGDSQGASNSRGQQWIRTYLEMNTRILTGMWMGCSCIHVHKRYIVSDDLHQKYTGHHTSKDAALQIAWWTPLIGSGRWNNGSDQEDQSSYISESSRGDKDANMM
jgi:hypothetical protein